MPQLRHRRVLLADDHDSMRDALAALLATDEQLELVASVPDGFAALDAARDERPDVAVLDINMPGGGLDLVRMLHGIDADLHIVVLSAVADAHRGAYLNEGAAVCLTKGDPPSAVLAAIKGRRAHR